VILLDTSGLLAALDASEAHHRAAAASLKQAGGPRILSPFVLAELDYMLARHVSQRVARSFLAEVADGAYELAHSTPTMFRARPTFSTGTPMSALGSPMRRSSFWQSDTRSPTS
jgi:predicted nucleic acid-binding protein